jgi:hypothetical protein
MRHHKGQKHLAHDFNGVWGKLKVSSRQSLQTLDGHDFDAFADFASKGSHQGQKVIRVKKDGQTFAYIDPCCWGCVTNCYGTWIGGYSEALDLWVQPP